MAGARLILRAMPYAIKPRPRIVERAIKKAGGVSALARKLSTAGGKISRAAVCQWRAIPPARARRVSKITGIPVEKLRPDLYGKS